MTDEQRLRDAESWYRDMRGCLNNYWDYRNELAQVTRFTADEVEERLEKAKHDFVIATLMEGGYE